MSPSPRLPPSPSTPPSDPYTPPTLEQLVQLARAPEVSKIEIDALLESLMRPLQPGQGQFMHAMLLRSILADPSLRTLRGSDGRRVDGTAAHAMVALGQPYAGQWLSEADRVALRETPLPGAISEGTDEGERDVKPQRASGSWQRIVGGVLLAVAVYEFSIAPKYGLALLFTGVTAVIPSFLLLFKLAPRYPWVSGLLIVMSGVLLPSFASRGVVLLFAGGSDAMLKQTSYFILWVLIASVLRAALAVALILAYSLHRKSRS